MWVRGRVREERMCVNERDILSRIWSNIVERGEWTCVHEREIIVHVFRRIVQT